MTTVACHELTDRADAESGREEDEEQEQDEEPESSNRTSGRGRLVLQLQRGVMSEGRKISTLDIQLVQNLIERCLQLYMTRTDVISTLQYQAKIEPGFTSLVWQKLEEQNPDFFRAYYTRLKLKDQIVLFNQVLEQHAQLLQKVRNPMQGKHHPAMQNGHPMHGPQYPGMHHMGGQPMQPHQAVPVNGMMMPSGPSYPGPNNHHHMEGPYHGMHGVPQGVQGGDMQQSVPSMGVPPYPGGMHGGGGMHDYYGVPQRTGTPPPYPPSAVNHGMPGGMHQGNGAPHGGPGADMQNGVVSNGNGTGPINSHSNGNSGGLHNGEANGYSSAVSSSSGPRSRSSGGLPPTSSVGGSLNGTPGGLISPALPPVNSTDDMLSHLPRNFSLSDLSLELSNQLNAEGDTSLTLFSGLPNSIESNIEDGGRSYRLPRNFSLSDMTLDFDERGNDP
ncbi:hypothetical protein CYMTET_39905 [Cymbomonas tetramitiformis]|uniref:Uncharacterized protein n=1 Tax=Cymbomonas tetramitiformis TaxID=36881 RepID=A0AAE0CAJ9_9CHLO|nr:hypothetical protein CYMTET_39905 [Cymbomonas tetramitiformis]